jgi:hypothetical protein
MAKGKNTILPQKQAPDAPSLLPELVGESFASGGYSRVGRNPTHGDARMTLNNLGNLDLPYGVINNSFITAQDTIELCQKAYARVPVFTTAIDTLTDLSDTTLHLRGGNSQSVKFFEALFKKVRMNKVKEQFFRESFMSGSVFLYRSDATISGSEVLKMTQLYAGRRIKAASEDVKIPLRYTLLNPANICVDGLANNMPVYHKLLSKFELQQLKNSGDSGDNETYKSIKDAVDKYAGGAGTEPIIQLDPTKLHVAFYRKQDYQPFATPMGYCVLDDINLKLELRKIDTILARSVELCILLVTMGEKESEGGTNPIAYNALKNTFKNDKIGRVLVGDYTTEAKFVTPDIGSLLGPAKYEEVNESIANGLMNIFFGESKYADSVNKLRALTKKIENVQQVFLDDFLNPEIKRISKILNFKSYPEAVLEPVRLEDQTNVLRVYAQLLQLGVLTPKDGLELIDTGLIPEYDTVETNQEGFKAQRDKGYFQPIQGGPFDQKEMAKMANDTKVQMAKNKPIGQSGRPGGTKSPQTTKKVSQVGASFSQKKVTENTLKMYALKDAFAAAYKSHFSIKRLGKAQKEIINTSVSVLAKYEQPENWVAQIENYLSIPSEKLMPDEVDNEIAGISAEYEVDTETATILYHSKA